jgi:hypothetical protein
MQGVIFLQLQRFAQKQGGVAAWENLLREAGLPLKSYSPARTYADEELLALFSGCWSSLARAAWASCYAPKTRA